MSKARNSENQKIESLEPLILMSATEAELGVDFDADNVFIAHENTEGKQGTAGDDILIGLGGDNCLHGEGGDDVFFTTMGNNNIVDGKDGTDTYRLWDGNRADFEIVSAGPGKFRISNGSYSTFVENVEKFEFNDGIVMAADLLTGNNPPKVITSPHISTPENQIEVITLEVTDADNDDVTFMLVEGSFSPDSQYFVIDPNTGVLSFKDNPDFENPAGGKIAYDVMVKVSDGKTTTITTLWINLTDVEPEGDPGNQAPSFTNIPVDKMVTVNENQTGAFDLAATDPNAGDTLTYTIQGGADAGLFNIDPNTGVLTFKNAPDFENPGDADGQNDYEVNVRVTDQDGLSDDDNLIIKVGDVQTNVDLGYKVAENTTLVGPQAQASTAGHVLGGMDADLFQLDGAGNISFKIAPDFENPGDADNDNSYEITRTVIGPVGEEVVETITVCVTDVNENTNQAPSFTNIPGDKMVTVNENQTGAFDLAATDPNTGDTLTYAIQGGADAGLFNIDPNTGVLTFKNAPDFENPGDSDQDNAYEVDVRVTDQDGLFDDDNLIIKVGDVNEGGGNQAPSFTNIPVDKMVTVNENQTGAFDLAATDPNAGDTLTYTIQGGVDAGLFNIDPNTGVLTFKNAPDFENPGDSDQDNAYEVDVRVTDQDGLFDDDNLIIKVGDVSEGGGNQAPSFTNIPVDKMVTVNENQTGAFDLAATDPNAGDTLTYTIQGGADAGLFNIDPNTGVLTFKNAPDFENPGDADGQNDYEVNVRVTDQDGLSDDDNLIIKVGDVNEDNPDLTVTINPDSISENGGTATGTVTRTGDTSQALTVTLSNDDTSEATFPATVTIPAGQSSATFTVTAVDDAIIDGTQVVTVTASATGYDDGTDTVDVTDDDAVGNQAPSFTNIPVDKMVTVNENQTGAFDLAATDPDAGDTLTYTIQGGADAGLFNIDPNTGVLTFKNAPDFENPGDADGQNDYEVNVRVTDQDGLSDDDNLIIKVGDVNEDNPDLTVTINPDSISENGGTATGTVTRTGDTSQALTVTLSNDDTSEATFPATVTIPAGQSSATFTVTAVDDAIIDGTQVVTVTASATGYDDGTDTVDVTDDDAVGNQAPSFTNIPVDKMVTVNENQTGAFDLAATDPNAGDTLTYTIQGGADAGLFNIDPNTGVLTFKNAPDFENPGDADGQNDYEVNVRVTDQDGLSDDDNLIIKVGDVNEGQNQNPFFTNVEEGEMVFVNEGTKFVGDANGQDPDGDTVTFSIAGGDDASRFTIDPNTGVLSFVDTPDFENPADADGNNQYKLTLRISDGKGGTQERNIVVKVNDVVEPNDNRSPFFTNVEEGEMVFVPENTTEVGDANGVDPDGDTVTFSIAGGDDAARFTINAQTGELSFITAPDFENPGDADGNNDYNLTLRISDGKGGTQDRNVVVKVTDVGIGGVDNEIPFFTNVEEGEVVTVVENNTFVGDANGTDPDGDTVTFSILGGPDAALFNVDSSTGVVTFITAPDFENPGDVGANNEYNLTLRISDGKGGTQDRNIVVKVLDANDTGGNNAPFFTNVEEGEIVTVPENTTSVGDANAQDADGDTLTYTISGGVDASLFNIDPNTGVVSFKAAPDFENPGDDDGDNNYQITLQVSDGNGGIQSRNVTIRVTDVGGEGGNGGNNAPFFTNVEEGEIVTVPENTTPVGDANAQDADGDTLTYTISGGVDASLFNIDANTGVVSFKTAPDFENPGDDDGNNNYQITLQVSDGNGGTQSRNVTIRVTDVGGEGGNGGNNAPFFTNVSEGENVTVPENTTSVGDANGQDPDGDTVTFSIVGGADASLFNINASTGVVSFKTAPDFENPGDANTDNSYQITLRIADGKGGTQDRNVTVQVTDVGNEGGGGLNQSPFFTNVSQGEVVTVVSGNTSVGDADAQDPNGDQITYSISGGADASLFTVNAQTGVVTFINAPDSANPGDADGNNLYQITLRASDGSLFQDRNVTVKVVSNNGGGGDAGQQNRAPFFINVEQGEFVWFDENRTFVGDANAVDQDGDRVTFSVVGGADAARFTINPQNGQLFFLNAPDFENPTDANGDNRYEVTIRVSDGQLFQDRSVVVGVEDVNEGGNNGGGFNGGGTNGGGSNGGGSNGGGSNGGGQYNNFFPWLNNSFYFSGYNGSQYAGNGGGTVY